MFFNDFSMILSCCEPKAAKTKEENPWHDTLCPQTRCGPVVTYRPNRAETNQFRRASCSLFLVGRGAERPRISSGAFSCSFPSSRCTSTPSAGTFVRGGGRDGRGRVVRCSVRECAKSQGFHRVLRSKRCSRCFSLRKRAFRIFSLSTFAAKVSQSFAPACI